MIWGENPLFLEIHRYSSIDLDYVSFFQPKHIPVNASPAGEGTARVPNLELQHRAPWEFVRRHGVANMQVGVVKIL